MSKKINQLSESTRNELESFLDFYLEAPCPDIVEALRLNSFDEVDVNSLLSLESISEAYCFRFKDAWKCWHYRARLGGAFDKQEG